MIGKQKKMKERRVRKKEKECETLKKRGREGRDVDNERNRKCRREKGRTE